MKFTCLFCFLIISLSSFSQTNVDEPSIAIALKGFFTVSIDSLEDQFGEMMNRDYPDLPKKYENYILTLAVDVNPYGCIDHIEYLTTKGISDTLIIQIVKKFLRQYHPCKVVNYESEVTGNPIPIDHFFYSIYFDPKRIKIYID